MGKKPSFSKGSPSVEWGNNRLTYQKGDISRKWPAEFEKRIKDALPKVIKFTNNSLDGIFERSISKVAEGTWEILVEDFKKAVSNDFFHTDITRSNIWDILYESAAGKLQLEISGRHVWWLFYKRVPSEIGLHDSKRFQLEKFPIACCIPHGQYEITKGQWELWLPQETKIEASVTFSDGFIHSFESERGFMAAADTFVFKSCTLYVGESIGGTDISGKYKLRRDGGKPSIPCTTAFPSTIRCLYCSCSSITNHERSCQ
jgi:hypothetical protein